MDGKYGPLDLSSRSFNIEEESAGNKPMRTEMLILTLFEHTTMEQITIAQTN